jgi:hypothetical protein
MNGKIVIGTVIGLVVGLVLGIFISPILLPRQTGVGTNNQVQVSGTVPTHGIYYLCFSSIDRSIETTANVTNGEYSVLLVGGQSYKIFNNYFPSNDAAWNEPDYNQFYVPLGVTTFTENLVQS